MRSLVWFKRDLRITDHLPLVMASDAGEVICLYVYEPELIEAEEFDPSHLVFINESLRELDENLRARGSALVLRRGSMPEVLRQIHEDCPFECLWSHEETGNRMTYNRDLRVADWCKEAGVEWTEIPQNGVERPIYSRDGWAARWNKR
ncbi:MAG: deoxyribodipyrimidine photo-lyase, partial [Verrucomicrobiota bacterium]